MVHLQQQTYAQVLAKKKTASEMIKLLRPEPKRIASFLPI